MPLVALELDTVIGPVTLTLPTTSRVACGLKVLMPTRPDDVMRMRSTPVDDVLDNGNPAVEVLNEMPDGMLVAFENGASEKPVMLLEKYTFASVVSVWFPPKAMRPRYIAVWMTLLGYTRASATWPAKHMFPLGVLRRPWL